jgi:hypothetical protein
VRQLTDRERRDEDIDRRRRRYLRVMLPYLVLVLLGFFLLPWETARIVVLVIALVMPPVAAILANAGRH